MSHPLVRPCSARLLGCGAALIVVVPSLFAQTRYATDPSVPQGHVYQLPDQDGDGVEDLMTASMTGARNFAQILSGATLVPLHTFVRSRNSGRSADLLGTAFELADVTGDGVPDFILGAPQALLNNSYDGAVTIFDGTDYSEILEIPGATRSDQGAALKTTDIDGDGRAELLVGAPDENGGAGSVRLLQFQGTAANLSTRLLRTYGGSTNLTHLGISIDVGDVTGDGLPDTVIGSDGSQGNFGCSTRVPGQVEVYEGRFNIRIATITGAKHRFARRLRIVDDGDGDGARELVVGSEYDNQAYVYAHSGGTMALATTLSPPTTCFAYGAGLHDAPDMNGDNVRDVIVMGTYKPCGSNGIPAVVVYSGANWQPILTIRPPQNESLGREMTIVDLRGDSTPEILFTTRAGLELWSQTPMMTTLDRTYVSRAGGGAVTITIDAGAANASKYFILGGSITGTTPGFPLGSLQVPLVPDFFTGIVSQLANTQPFVNFIAPLDSNGVGQAQWTYLANLPAALDLLPQYYAPILWDPVAGTLFDVGNPVVLHVRP